MKVFAIGDLHLPGGDNKPMDVFGAHWGGHFERICQDWQARVMPDDVVLVPGDISWAMQMQDALPDLLAIGALPGQKVLLRGNHDYWWNSITRLRAFLPGGMYALQNDAIRIGDVVICGSRGWTLPQNSNDPADEKIFTRELMRMEMSLQRGKALGGQALIAMTHYPPITEKGEETAMSALMTQYGVDEVVYGHLHGASLRGAFGGIASGVHYTCVSCDGLNFTLKQVLPILVEDGP